MSNILNIALQEYGQKEFVGKANNPRILNYFTDTGVNPNAITEETSWCSAFINWCALKSNMERTGKLNARSWMEVGRPIVDPILGDVVILWRESPSSWKGHVALFVSETKSTVSVLGGNQSDSVCIRVFPKIRVLGYRRLRRQTIIDKAIAEVPDPDQLDDEPVGVEKPL